MNSAAGGGAGAGAEGLADLLDAVAASVGARGVEEVLPRVRAAVAGALALPVLDGFASNVCAMVESTTREQGAGDSDGVRLEEALVAVAKALAEQL
jgi:hypothetical protein